MAVYNLLFYELTGFSSAGLGALFPDNEIGNPFADGFSASPAHKPR